MTLHLMKLCVGIENINELSNRQQQSANSGAHNKKKKLRHITRYKPKRAEEILNGGSMFWVIRRLIQVRQTILGFEEVPRDDGKSACGIVLSPELVAVRTQRQRPFQGWRYFSVKDAPPDLLQKNESGLDELPYEMSRELQELGLI